MRREVEAGTGLIEILAALTLLSLLMLSALLFQSRLLHQNSLSAAQFVRGSIPYEWTAQELAEGCEPLAAGGQRSWRCVKQDPVSGREARAVFIEGR